MLDSFQRRRCRPPSLRAQLDKIKIPQMEGMKALDDCFANSQRSLGKGYGPVTQSWHKASSDRCVIAKVQRAIESDPQPPKSEAAEQASGMAYALGVAHFLKQRGDNKGTAKALAAVQPPQLAAFATDLQELMRKKAQNPGAKCK